MKRYDVVNARAAQSRRRAPRWTYGINAIRRRLEVRPESVRELCVLDRRSPRLKDVLRLVPPAVLVRDVDEETLSRIVGSSGHQGIAARTGPYEYSDLETILARHPDLLLAVDQMQDPQNFGALLRTAAAAGVSGVVIPRDGAVGVTPAAEKAAAGAVNDIPVCQVVNLRRALNDLAVRGFWNVGLVPRGGESLFDVNLPGRIALVLGGETGLRPLVLEGCDIRISIPMHPGVESLNASAAGAIALFEVMRRRSLDR